MWNDSRGTLGKGSLPPQCFLFPATLIQSYETFTRVISRTLTQSVCPLSSMMYHGIIIVLKMLMSRSPCSAQINNRTMTCTRNMVIPYICIISYPYSDIVCDRMTHISHTSTRTRRAGLGFSSNTIWVVSRELDHMRLIIISYHIVEDSTIRYRTIPSSAQMRTSTFLLLAKNKQNKLACGGRTEEMRNFYKR